MKHTGKQFIDMTKNDDNVNNQILNELRDLNILVMGLAHQLSEIKNKGKKNAKQPA